LISLDYQVQKERSLFHRIRAVSYDYAVQVTDLHELVDAFCQLEHDLKRHILRSDIRNLLALDVGHVLDTWNSSDHRVNGYSARGISCLCATRSGARDRSAGSEDDDVWSLWCDRVLLRERVWRNSECQK